MKTLLLSTAAAVLILGAPSAFAADHHDDKKGGHEVSAHAAVRVDAHHGSAMGGTPHAHMGGGMMATHHETMSTTVHPVVTSRHHHVSGAMSTPSVVHSETMRSHAGENHGGVHVNIDIHTFQRNVHATRHFHAGAYRAPHGYSYRRWTFGERLPSDYFVRDYWITDYSSYALMDPPDGYVWVRYGDDALLINQDSGEIVQVDYDVFD